MQKPDNSQTTSMLNLIAQIRASLALPSLQFDKTLNSYLPQKDFSTLSSALSLESFKKYPIINIAGCNKIFSTETYSYSKIKKQFLKDDSLRSIIFSPGNTIYLETGTINHDNPLFFYLKICIALDISQT